MRRLGFSSPCRHNLRSWLLIVRSELQVEWCVWKARWKLGVIIFPDQHHQSWHPDVSLTSVDESKITLIQVNTLQCTVGETQMPITATHLVLHSTNTLCMGWWLMPPSLETFTPLLFIVFSTLCLSLLLHQFCALSYFPRLFLAIF